KGHFERMIVIAPPGFLGVLRRIVPKTVQRKVVASVAKDFTNFSTHELPKRVRAVIPPTTGMPP
ncbi:MAG: host attachment protein, partial [Deltaproteobacteria bacterium]|nr:host attachment protein [Deltaproteobacteria bacterium]